MILNSETIEDLEPTEHVTLLGDYPENCALK